MTGPCMCGDLCCPSCGPAQGNWRCPVCRAWASDGCDCSEAEMEAAAKAEAAADAAYAAQCIEDIELGEQYRDGDR